MNDENLIPNSERTPSELREMCRKGGIKSGEVRRAKRTLKEELLLLLEQGDNQNKMSLAILEKALNGDTKAFEIIRDTIGQKPKDIVENINPPTINIGDVKI